MNFVSLNDPQDIVNFREALERGIARDGSLYVPAQIPQLSEEEVARLVGADRQTVAKIMLTPWLADEIPGTELEAIIRQASTFDTPVIEVGDKRILELFHGPTMAFKDVAARYLAAFMSYFNQQSGRNSTVLVATSGDTGGAIAHGFGGVDRVKVVVLYPKGRVSQLQQEQLRRVAPNVCTLEVEGSFDDCQKLVKQAMADPKLVSELGLTSANSISIGRLLPQSTYYANTYAQLGNKMGRFVVPSGNLGNLTGGLIARAVGVPIAAFLAANNANDTLVRYINTGLYEPAETVPTLSNAMDVGAPNNLPRMIHLFADNMENMRATLRGVKVSDEQTIATIQEVYEETGYLLDPHTAVAWWASEMEPANNENADIIVSTASPLKFAEEIAAKTGIKVDNTSLLEKLRQHPERYWNITNSIDELTEFLRRQHRESL